MRTSIVGSFAALLLALVVGATVADASSPAEDGLLPEERAAAESFERISPAFEQLSELDGFESGGVKPGTDELEVYWSGRLTAVARRIVAEAEARGEPVHVRTVLSYERAREASLEVARALSDAGIQLSGFGPNRANDTIELLGPDVSVDEEVQDRARRIAEDVLPEGIGVEFIPDESGPSVFFGAGTYDGLMDLEGAPSG